MIINDRRHLGRCKLLVPTIFNTIRLNPNIRFYRYGPAQAFGPHVDMSDVDYATRSRSMFTVLFYLNDADDSGLEGGRTIFYADHHHGAADYPGSVALAYRPRTGTVLLHGHGDQCLTHEGEKVTKGTKYLLRTDVMYSL